LIGKFVALIGGCKGQPAKDHVRFGSLADIGLPKHHESFAPGGGSPRLRYVGPLSSKSRHPWKRTELRRDAHAVFTSRQDMLRTERAVDLGEGGGGIGDVEEVHAGRNLSHDVRKIIPALKRSSCRDQLRGLIVVDLRPGG